MQVNDIGGAGTLMQVIDILCNNGNIKVFLKGCNKAVSFVGLNGKQFATALVVELKYKCRICCISLWCGNLLYRVVIPQTTATTEGCETTFHTHTCTGKYHNPFHYFLIFKR